jgi:hypothetical protein
MDRGRGAHPSCGSAGGRIGWLGVLHGLGFPPSAGALLCFQKQRMRLGGGKEMTVGSRSLVARRCMAGPGVVMGRSGGAGPVG